jgi:ferric-dicitrate binding protein FerR (iron transport regulator)
MTQDQDSKWEKIAAKIHGENIGEETDDFTTMDFEKIKNIHDRMIEAGNVPSGNLEKSWLRVERGIRRTIFHTIRKAMQYAAIVAVAFLAGYILHHSTQQGGEILYSEVSVPFGQMSNLTLSDGTKIWLNSGSTLRYPERFAQNSREVTLEGEAFFKVAKMPDKPFIVHSTKTEVRVLGTSFNMSAYSEDEASSLTLVEGKVALTNLLDNSKEQLTPGQMGTVQKNKSGIAIHKVETQFYTTWVKGKIYFDDERLDEISLKLERWFNVDISFADEKLKSYRFTGTILKNKPVDQVMQALEILAPIRFKHQINAEGKDKITIYEKI